MSEAGEERTPAGAGQSEQVCSAEPGCITCGDVAVPLSVLAVDGHDARCCDEQGRVELVATELVGTVQPGDRLLVHAGVAIERLGGQRVPGRKAAR